MNQIEIGIIGAGLAGQMAAALLSKLPGVHVTVFEKRKMENKVFMSILK